MDFFYISEGEISLMVLTFSSSISIPLSEILCLRNLISLWKNLHFHNLICRLAFRISSNTWITFSKCCLAFQENIMISSKYTTAHFPITGLSISFIKNWNHLNACLSPKSITRNSNCPIGITNIVY